jgi:pyrroloquinoline-quinone synthase
MTPAGARAPLSRDEFIEWVRREGEHRYHDHHRYHVLMHDGKLTQLQLQQWVLNRYYYQTRVPIKDAIILSKSEDPTFRRMWIRRIRDHDGDLAGEGGLELWLRLAEGVGLDREEVASCRSVLPGVRFACDGYVELVRERTLLEAVASSLTEFFSPDLMTRRVLAWERHYPWISRDTLEYFRTRPPRARQDSLEAIDFVVAHADTYESQARCVAALIRKTEILWHLLDCLHTAYVEPGWGQAAPVPDVSAALAATRGHGRPRCGFGGITRTPGMLLYGRGLVLNATAADVAQLCTGDTRSPRSSSAWPTNMRLTLARPSSGRCWPS